MDNMTIAGGVGALVLGFIIGNVTGGGAEFDDPGPKLATIESQIAELAAGNTATNEAIAALGARFDASDSSLESVGGQFEGMTSQLGSLEEKIGSGFSSLDGMGSQLGTLQEQMSEGFTALTGAVSSQSETLTTGLAGLAAAGAAAVATSTAGASEETTQAESAKESTTAAAATTAASTESDETETAAATQSEETTQTEETTETAATETGTETQASEETAETVVEGFSVGRTATLADGEVRAFVSRVNADAGMAEIAVNGFDRMALSVGHATGFDGATGASCLLSLLGIQDGAAQLTAACGDDRPEAMGAKPGTTVKLADGVNAFVSYGGANMARIAINGQDTVLVEVGKSTPVASKYCGVKVEGVDRGRVALSSDC